MVNLERIFFSRRFFFKQNCILNCILGVGDLVNLSNTLQPPLQPHDPANNENCIFDQLDAAQLSRHHHQNSTSNREFSNRKMSMSPYLSPTSKLSSSLSHSGLLGSNLPLRRQLSNKSSLSLAGGAFYTNFEFSFTFPSLFTFLFSFLLLSIFLSSLLTYQNHFKITFSQTIYPFLDISFSLPTKHFHELIFMSIDFLSFHSHLIRA